VRRAQGSLRTSLPECGPARFRGRLTACIENAETGRKPQMERNGRARCRGWPVEIAAVLLFLAAGGNATRGAEEAHGA